LTNTVLSNDTGLDRQWSILIAKQLFEKNQKISINSEAEFDVLVEHARANKALARILQAVQGTSPSVRKKIDEARAEQDRRLREASTLLQQTQKVCLDLNVPYSVIKSLDALPDLGHDIDLLVGRNLTKVRGELMHRFQCYPVTLTFCDRQARKFSTFIEKFSFDFELYAMISQLGEEYYPAQVVLENSRQASTPVGMTYLCAKEDRFLITCIHTMYRHGKIRLSDLNIAYEVFRTGIDLHRVLATVQYAGIQKGFALFVRILEKTSRDSLGRNLVPYELQEYAKHVLDSDIILAKTASSLKQTFPLKIPIIVSMLLFLYKAASDASRAKFSSFLRSLIAPIILAIDKSLPLKLQKAIAVRIW